MTAAVDLPEKDSYSLVEFVYGDPLAPQYARYTDWDQNVGEYLSFPDMGVALPENTGTFGEAYLELEMGVDDFTGPLCSGEPASEVYVTVTEVTKSVTGGPSASNLVMFKGKVVRTIRNQDGRADTCLIKCSPAKARLNKTLGLPGNHHCVLTFLGRGCSHGLLTKAQLQRSGEIAVISGKNVTISPNAGITSPASFGGRVDRYWERGYLERNGIQIGIHIWKDTSPTVFRLRSRPPADWLLAGAASIVFVPGCHKTIEDCREVHDNEERILNFGYDCPAYNPIYENPA